MNRVRTVPERYRKFVVTRDRLSRRFGVSDDLVEALLDLGMPHRGNGDDLRLDPIDLENVSMSLKLLSPETVVLNRWSRTLTPDMQNERGFYDLRVTWTCPMRGHAGPCEYTTDQYVLELMAPGSFELPATGSLSTSVEPLHEVHYFGPEFDPVVEEARKIEFHRLPDELSADLGYVHSTGLADCQSGNMHLMRIAEDQGMSVRPATGFFVGAPFAAVHGWFEVRAGERWVPADPFYLSTLGRWGIIEPDEWPLNRSPRNIFVRLRPQWAADYVIQHNGKAARVNILANWKPFRLSPGTASG
uniref:Putative MitI transglutaminase n=1 Tax=Amycolatopsis sp. SANK 60206 TaxID=1642649 RepID=A0A0E3USD3_9PSEU|nr:putative MitI transglutaminase [Amycolatopsis sp. SANK 60206]